jgi:triacylglycerol lipase
MAMFDLLPEATGFKLENALALAHAAELAYEDEPRIRETVLDHWGCEHFHFFDRKGTRAFAMANERVVIVAFRGIERERCADWITNLQLDLTKGPLGGRVHAGLHKGLNAVWKDINRVVKGLRANQSRSLWFTGHGLGAALATLAVARLVELDQPVYGLYTFGSPRVGDRKFSRNFNFEYRPRMFRFVNNNDTVTRIPLVDAELIDVDGFEVGFQVQLDGLQMPGDVLHLGQHAAVHQGQKRTGQRTVADQFDLRLARSRVAARNAGRWRRSCESRSRRPDTRSPDPRDSGRLDAAGRRSRGDRRFGLQQAGDVRLGDLDHFVVRPVWRSRNRGCASVRQPRMLGESLGKTAGRPDQAAFPGFGNEVDVGGAADADRRRAANHLDLAVPGVRDPSGCG